MKTLFLGLFFSIPAFAFQGGLGAGSGHVHSQYCKNQPGFDVCAADRIYLESLDRTDSELVSYANSEATALLERLSRISDAADALASKILPSLMAQRRIHYMLTRMYLKSSNADLLIKEIIKTYNNPSISPKE